jgi:hypothetical protein
VDNCPLVANADQADADADGRGNACDACPADAANDADSDGDCGNVDNCPLVANPDQADADADGRGNACDACPADPANDADGDGVCGNVDNCPLVANADQADADADGIGDACDLAPPTACTAAGAGWLGPDNKRYFTFGARSQAGVSRPLGYVIFGDANTGDYALSASLTGLTCAGSDARISGFAWTPSGVVSFTVDVHDGGPRGAGDTFAIGWPAYQAAGPVTGEVAIQPR